MWYNVYMKKRSYKKSGDTYTALSRMTAQLASCGIRELPGERVLAEELQVSRMTLRKALAEAENAGLINRSDKRTMICGNKRLEACGRILFIASGRNTAFSLPALERLWLNLRPAALIQGAQLDLFLANDNTNPEEITNAASNAHVILLGSILGTDVELTLRNLASLKKIIIALQPNKLFGENIVSLDNRAAGALAAKALLRAGSRNITAVNYQFHNHNLGQEERIAGLAEALRTSGLTPEILPVPSLGFDSFFSGREQLLNAVQNGSDGIFIPSDEGIGFITADLFRMGLIPERCKLVSLNGCGEALRHDPPIACVSHATSGVIEELLKQLDLIAHRRWVAPVKIFVKPELYFHPTLSFNPVSAETSHEKKVVDI